MARVTYWMACSIPRACSILRACLTALRLIIMSYTSYNFQEAAEGKRACVTEMSAQPTDPEEIRARANADPEIQVW